MLVQKTEIAKLTLQSRQIVLTPKQRQLLILADGMRSSETLSEMVGRDVSAELEILIAMKMLMPMVQKEQHTQAVTIQDVTATPNTFSGKKQSRRSLAATKMYLIDVLQMMRDLDASSLAVSLHASETEQDFVDNVMDSIQFIAFKNGNSYANRVFTRVFEVIPENHLTTLNELERELELTKTI
jgi:hypothetical protein